MLGLNRDTISARFSLYEEKGLDAFLEIHSPSGVASKIPAAAVEEITRILA